MPYLRSEHTKYHQLRRARTDGLCAFIFTSCEPHQNLTQRSLVIVFFLFVTRSVLYVPLIQSNTWRPWALRRGPFHLRRLLLAALLSNFTQLITAVLKPVHSFEPQKACRASSVNPWIQKEKKITFKVARCIGLTVLGAEFVYVSLIYDISSLEDNAEASLKCHCVWSTIRLSFYFSKVTFALSAYTPLSLLLMLHLLNTRTEMADQSSISEDRLSLSESTKAELSKEKQCCSASWVKQLALAHKTPDCIVYIARWYENRNRRCKSGPTSLIFLSRCFLKDLIHLSTMLIALRRSNPLFVFVTLNFVLHSIDFLEAILKEAARWLPRPQRVRLDLCHKLCCAPVGSCLNFYLYLGLENRSKNHGLRWYITVLYCY